MGLPTVGTQYRALAAFAVVGGTLALIRGEYFVAAAVYAGAIAGWRLGQLRDIIDETGLTAG
jgi:uncharacterized membrane protein YeiH